MASSYMTYTPGEAGTSHRTGTISAWVKRGDVSASQRFWGVRYAASHSCEVTFNEHIQIYANYASSEQINLRTTAKYKDPSAWYHVVVAIDTTQSVEADRVKLYVNGVQNSTFSTYTNYPALNDDLLIGHGYPTSVGAQGAEGSNMWNGGLSHVQYVDGLQLAPTEFGEVDATSGIWKIKPDCYATPGINGFCLKMEDRTNLDLDSSSNAKPFTTVGTITATYDNPSNNFATLNILGEDTAATYTYTNANTTVDISSGWCSLPLTLGAGAGKWYFEAKLDTLGNYAQVGWATNDWMNEGGAESYFGTDASGTNLNSSCGMGQDGPIYNSTTAGNQTSVTYGDAYVAGKYIGCALDLDNGFAYWSIDGVWQNSGVPTSGATGTGAFTIDNPTAKGYLWLPGVAANTAKWSINTGNGYFGTTLISSPEADDGGIGAFKYDVPAGYRTVCTRNIKAYG